MIRTLPCALAVLAGAAAPACPDPEPAAMVIQVTTDKAAYRGGEPIVLRLTATNPADTAVTLGFFSGQRYDFLILAEAGDTVWRWGADRGFIQALGEETVPPNGRLAYSETFEGRLPPGRYRARGVLTAAGDPRAAEAVFRVE